MFNCLIGGKITYFAVFYRFYPDMKRFSRILFYLRSQKRNIVLYLIFILFSIIFSLISLAMLAPFLQLLFGEEKLVMVRPEFEYSAKWLLNTF
jgi:ATP-binding cassette, subfamily B, bacterial MsbA